MAKVVIDAGHGGRDPGAVYNDRMEKDDALDLALAVGRILADHGVDVSYTRTTDIYNTPYEKAMMGNNADADLFVSFHRNATVNPGALNGSETLVYADRGIPAQLARNINERLEQAGFLDRGVTERPNLVVLRRTRMPAVLVEAGFIDSETDNQIFDENFQQIAQAIADGILETLGEETAPQSQKLYRVQVGSYRNSNYANQLLTQLKQDGFPAFIVFEDGYYRVQVGAFRNLDNAVNMERRLRQWGYDTFITT